MGDSKYCLLVSQSLIEHRTFDLSDYSLFPANRAVFKNPISIRKGIPYQLERHKTKLYHHFPPGTSILSVPFVALSMILGISPAEQNIYSTKKELQLQLIIASFLMSCLVAISYLTARLLLNHSYSILITIALAFGTMVWSIASRVLTSHTWSIFLLTLVIYLLLKNILGENKEGAKGAILATLLAWAYFVRPTFAISIVGITLYYMYINRRLPIFYFVTGALWFILFLLYSHFLLGQWLPNYYLPTRISLGVGHSFWNALAGVLVSPSRGIVIFVPTLFACLYMCIKYRNFLPHKSLSVLAIGVLIFHTILISSFRQWWGGYSYGPRFFTDVLPWCFLIGVLSIKARENALHSANVQQWNLKLEPFVISVLLIVTLFLHGIGSWSDDAWKWNEQPTDIDTNPDRLWDWYHPQFLSFLEISE